MKKRAIAVLVVVAAVLCILLVWVAPHVYRWVVSLASAFARDMDVVKVCALIVAVCALTVAWNSYRRSNAPVIRIIRVASTAGQSVASGWRLVHRFEVTFRNLGIPLRRPAVSIGAFAGGWFDVPLVRYRDGHRLPDDGGGVLEKGMVAAYGISSLELDAGRRAMLSALVRPDATSLCISIWSDGYLVKRFKLPNRPWLDGLRHRWNSLSWWAREFFDWTTVYEGGQVVHHHPKILPSWDSGRWQFESFVQSVAKEAEHPQPAQPPGPSTGGAPGQFVVMVPKVGETR